MASYDEADVKRRICQAYVSNRSDCRLILADLDTKALLPAEIGPAYKTYYTRYLAAMDAYTTVLAETPRRNALVRQAAYLGFEAAAGEAIKPLAAAMAQYLGKQYPSHP